MARRHSIRRPGRYVTHIPKSPPTLSVESNFTKGLITESTGLNFPENACTQTDNCVFSILGEVSRRGGINPEENGTTATPDNAGGSYSSYRWKNAGGDGESEIVVQQVTNILFFYLSSQAGIDGTGVSDQFIGSIDINIYATHPIDPGPGEIECQYADGNGYLFIFNSSAYPLYIVYDPSTQAISANVLIIKIRDYIGVIDNLGVQGDPGLLTTRPGTLSNTHEYNLENQGWAGANSWAASSATTVGAITSFVYNVATGNHAFTVASGITPAPTAGNNFTATGTAFIHFPSGITQQYPSTISGTVVSYVGTTLTLNVTAVSGPPYSVGSGTSITSEFWSITQTGAGATIGTWFAAIGNYPSNADIWWQFKNTSGVFAPTTSSILNVSLPNTQAPSGHFILDAFNQDRQHPSGIGGLTSIVTEFRPGTGAWFAGRVWYSGVNDTQQASSDQNTYSWTENIYYSQVVSNPNDFGHCYSINDPTNETFFDPLPTDGGIIVIPGAGNIHKLFPIANGLLVMADNGIWIISGSSGYGFDSTSYVVSKIPNSPRVMSASSIVDVLGLPVFWNLEGIYSVQPSKENAPYGLAGFTVQPLTVGTILSFYNSIPTDSKRYAKGAYDPIGYVVQWTYRSTQESNINTRYYYDSILNLNTFNKSFYTHSITTDSERNRIVGIIYVDYPQGDSEPRFKYPYVTPGSLVGFAEENDFDTFKDWGLYDATASFTIGYRIKAGQAFKKWTPVYVNMYLRNDGNMSYTIESIWDFNRRTSQPETRYITDTGDGLWNRHKLRGHGRVFQLKVTSNSTDPFVFWGWSIPEQAAMGS